MSEFSMFELLMCLPLFRGASMEHISHLVEKTHLDFNSFNPGENVIKRGTPCNTLCCLLSGRLEISHPLFSSTLFLREEAKPGRYLGAERLFGLDNKHTFSAKAITRCGTMEITKKQFLDLVSSEQLYLLNTLNYLSRGAQRCVDSLLDFKTSSLRSFLSFLIDSLTSRESVNISITSDGETVLKALRNLIPFDVSEFRDLEQQGILDLNDEHTLLVRDRERLMDFHS